MSKISFLGASGTVTGSSYLLQGNQTTILVDYGMFQESHSVSRANHDILPIPASSIDAVFITHAHLDHCGRLPLLAQNGFTRTIYMTQATRDIVEVVLLDSAHIAESDDEEEPLYTREDVEKIMRNVSVVPYDSSFTIGEYSITFRNAGHILGSASIEISDSQKKYVFSGDLGNTPEDLVNPTEPITKGDVVVMETTYGDRTHADVDASEVLQSEINEVEKTGGVLLIPAFSIERTQEIMHRLGHLQKAGRIKTETPIFVDSPMALKVTEIFKKYPNLYNHELSLDHHPFDLPNLTLCESVEESKEILKVPGAKIIIAGSGMMNGGRILHHLKNYLPIPTTRVLIVGYQAKGTLGSIILDGAKHIILFHKYVSIAAHIAKISVLSSHADEPKLLKWLSSIAGVKQLFLIHGEDGSREIFAKKVKETFSIPKIILPKKGETYEV